MKLLLGITLALGLAGWALIILVSGVWAAVGLAAIWLFGFIALANLVNYGHVLPPDNEPPSWWR